MEYFIGKLKGDISQVYTDLINCDVGTLGWIGRKYPDNFSLKKRKGYNSVKSISGYECTDIITIDGGNYYMFIKKDRTNIKIYKDVNGTLTELYSGNFKEGLYERFTRYNFVKGEPRTLFSNDTTTTTSSTGVENRCIQGDYLTDTNGKTYDTNSIQASDYLYVYDYGSTITDDTGTPGQAFVINSVSDYKIGIQGSFILGDKVKGDNVKYCVLPQWGEVFGFVTSEGFITWHSDNFFTKGGLTPNNISAVEYHQGTLNLLTTNGVLFVGRRGGQTMFIDVLSQIYVGDYFNLVSFNNYLVLFSKYKIGVVTLEDDKTSGYIIPTLYSATSSYGIYDKYSFVNYEDSLYIATNYKRIAAISIIPSGIDKFVIQRKFEKYFDGQLEVSDFNEINIKNTDQRLYVFTTNGTNSDIYIYDQYYSIWLKHTVSNKKILNYNFSTDEFYGDNVYSYSGTQDDGVDFTQTIKFKFGDNILDTIKRVHLLKMVLGPNTSEDFNLNIFVTYNGQTKKYIYTGLNNRFKLSNNGDNNSGGYDTLGESVLGDNTLGESPGVETTKGYLTNIEYDLGLTGEVVNFSISSTEGFELLSFIIGYDSLLPHITEIGNVYLFNH